MLQIYSHLSPGAFAAVMIGLSILAFTVFLGFVKRFLPGLSFGKESSEASEIYAGAIGTMFALIFAFVIIAVWQNFAQVSTTVSQEANVLHNIYRSLNAYPPEFRDPVQAKLRAYVNQVVKVEWDRIAYGEQDPVAHEQITELNDLLTKFKPATLGDLPVQQEMLQLLLLNRNLRHDRIRGGLPYLDLSMWISLYFGIFILMVFSALMPVPVARQHYLMHGALGASMGLVLFLLLVYNYPFLGPGSITADPLRVLPEQFWILK